MFRKLSKKLKIAIGIIGGFMFLCVCGCVGFYLLGKWAESDPHIQATGTARAIVRATGTALAIAQATEDVTQKDLLLFTLTPTLMRKPTLTQPSQTIIFTPTATTIIFPSEPILLNSLSDYENSEFCKVYGCEASDSWELKSGGINHTYDLNTRPDVSVEVSTINDKPVDFYLTFYDRDMLGLNDYQLVFLFLKAVHPGATIDDTIEQYIQQNVEKDLFQICEANPIEFGLLKIWAGRIFQQTIHIGQDCLR